MGGRCLLIKGNFFAWFETMQRKQKLASALGIKKEIGGNHAFFHTVLTFATGIRSCISRY